MAKKTSPADIQEALAQFIAKLKPVEALESLILFTDNRTGARFYDCHISAGLLVASATPDVPLDPEQEEYRANREVVIDDDTFAAMKEDAKKGRTFSNLVTEFIPDGTDTPLKIIGGQHRFQAIKEALNAGVDELHGIKVYFGLDNAQRLDAQLISNTNIEVSAALADRLKETYRGPHLRTWCQSVGLLGIKEDF